MRLTIFLLIVCSSFLGAQQYDFDNLPQSVIEQLRTNSEVEDIEVEDNLEIVKENETEKIVKLDEVFGHSFFESPNNTKTPILDIPLSSDYRISFNDELELLLTGGNEKLLNLRVDLSGSVLIPGIGEVSLVELTLATANKKISELVENTFVGTKSSLSVKKPSIKKITVIGAVKDPGTYLVNPFISLSEAIKYAGGLEKYASLRNIEVISLDGKVKQIDLYDFLIFGDRNVDINLKNGETVKINSTSNIFSLLGSVNRPMKYEYAFGDKVSELIEFGLSFQRNADESNLVINTFQGEGLESQKIGIDNIIAAEFDSLFVSSSVYERNLMVKVIGDGVTQGYFSYEYGDSLLDFLKKIRTNSNNFEYFALLRQEDYSKGKLVKESIAFSKNDVDALKKVKLKQNPELTFISFDFLEIFNENVKKIKSDLQIKSFNELKKTDDYAELNFEDNSSFQAQFEGIQTQDLVALYLGDDSDIFYLPLAGKINLKNLMGLFPRNNLNMNNVTIVNADKTIFNGLNATINASEVASIIVPKKAKDLVTVEIYGEVLNPGTYQLSSSSSLNDLYRIAGGFTDNSFSNGIIFSRQSLRQKEFESFEKRKQLLADVLISKAGAGLEQSSSSAIELISFFDSLELEDFQGRMRGDFSEGSLLSKSITLEKGDIVIVPSFSNTVTVLGEVLSPGTISLINNGKFKQYIGLAGGLSDFASSQNIFITKADGTTTQDKNYILQPGDTINVPKNFEKIAPLPLFSIIAQTFSDLALAAASLNILNN